MDIVVKRDEFIKALQAFSKVVKNNSIRPILSGVLIEATEKGILLKGTNLELSLIQKISGSVLEKGTVCVEISVIFNYINNLTTENIQLKSENNVLIVKNNTCYSEFVIFDFEDFPKINFTLDNSKDIDIQAGIFIKGIQSVIGCTAKELDNPALHSIQIEFSKDLLTFSATDSFRCVFFTLDIKNDKEFKLLIPLESAETITKLFKEDDELKIKFDANRITINTSNILLMSRLCGLDFPNLKGVLENLKENTKIELSRKEFIQSLKRADSISKDTFSTKHGCKFTVLGNKLQIYGINEKAKFKENLDIVKYGSDLNIGINVKYLLEFLNLLGDNNITLCFQNETSAISIKTSCFQYLLMPLALSI